MKQLCYFFGLFCFFVSITVNAGDIIVNAKRTSPEEKGLIISVPETGHSQFIHSKERSNQLKQSFISSPAHLRDDCHACYLPMFGELSKTLSIRKDLYDLTTAYKQVSSLKSSSVVIIDGVPIPLHVLLAKMGAEHGQITKNYNTSFRESISSLMTQNKNNPLYFLGECAGPTCTLSRHKEKLSCPRENVIEQIVNKLPRDDQQKNIVFYASGRCFFEVELLVRLVEQSFKLGNIVLIDPYMEPTIDFILHFNPPQGDITEEFILEKLSPSHAAIVFQLAQIVYFLNNIGFDGNISVYPNHQEYLHHSVKASVIVAMDYLDHENKVNAEDNLTPQLQELFNNALEIGGAMITAKSIINGDVAHPLIEIRNK